MKTHLFKIALAMLGLCSVDMAQTVVDVVVSKQESFAQTDASTTSVSGWAGSIFVDGNSGSPDNISAITAPTYTTPAPSSGTLSYDNTSDTWIQSANYLSQTALDTAMPNGAYTVTVNGAVVSLSLTGNSYPNTPLASVNAGTWSGNVLYFDPSQSLTITTNAATFGSNGGHISLDVQGGSFASTVTSYNQFGASGISGTLTIDANSFITGQSYTVEMQFNNVISQDTTHNPNGTGTNSTNVGVYTTFTSFTVTAIPEPSTYAALAGLMVLAAAFGARRRQWR